MNKVLLISGPTGTGKTVLSIDLAKKFKGELISADSRQIYRGLNIGTNKFPGEKNKWLFKKSSNCWTYDKVPVYLYDVIAPSEKFSAYDFVVNAQKIITGIWTRDKLPIVVGGTGFYQKSLVYPFETIGIPPDYKLRAELEKLSTSELFERLEYINPLKAESIDSKNRRRLIRAIEVTLTRVNANEGFEKISFDYLWVGLKAPREVLIRNSFVWIEKILNEGILQEVLSLINAGYRAAPVLNTIIYKPTVDYLDGILLFDEYVYRLKKDVKNYIKRQLTWFNKQAEIIWFDITSPTYKMELEKKVASWLNGNKHD